jgi:DNA-binding NtrC family response regulator
MKFNALLDSGLENNEELKSLLQEEENKVHSAPEQGLLLEEIAQGRFNIVFLACGSCVTCGEESGTRIKSIKEVDPRIEIICISEQKDDIMPVEAIKNGATACFYHPLDLTSLKETIDNIKALVNVRRETYQIETALNEKYVFSNMVSKNPAMLDIFSLVRRVAPYYRTMLITGGTGTGKELLARAIHHLSNVPKEPFITCNCSGLVENLIESELFGHVKGAFTGAVSDKRGLFEAADNGAILLDEIGDMPLNFQPHFLRVLQNGEFRRVGSTKTMKAACRVIATTNLELYEKVKQGLFREDLYFRLAVITIKLPQLKERKEDIPLLCYFFLNKLNKSIGKNVRGITLDAKRLLISYDWPGNIRELENVLERAVLVTTANFIRVQDIPSYIGDSLKRESPSNLSLDEVEKHHIQSVLTTTGGNKTKAATLLGISRRALHRKIIKYHL